MGIVCFVMKKCPHTCIYVIEHHTYERRYYHHLSNSSGCFWGKAMPSPEIVAIPAYKDEYIIFRLYLLKSLDGRVW